MLKRMPLSALMLVTIMAACSAGPPASAESSSVASPSASAVAPSASQGASAEPSSAGRPVPIGNCCLGAALLPGRYVTPEWLAIPISLQFGADWRAIRNDHNLALAFIRGANEVGNGESWLAVFAPSSDKVDAFLADLRATPLLQVGGGVAEPIEIAGYAGEQIDAQALPNQAQAGNEDRMPDTVDIPAMRALHSQGITDFSWYTESSEARLRFIFVEIGDHTLILYIEAPPSEFDAHMEVVNGVLDSIEIVPPAEAP